MDLETVRSGMFGVVNHARGTGKAARLKKVAVFGKTGTARKVQPGGGYSDSGGAAKVGYCTCQLPNANGNRTWSCASDTAFAN